MIQQYESKPKTKSNTRAVYRQYQLLKRTSMFILV